MNKIAKKICLQIKVISCQEIELLYHMGFSVHDFTIIYSKYSSPVPNEQSSSGGDHHRCSLPLLIIVILNKRFDIAKILLTHGDNINKAGICMFASVLNKDLDMLIFMKYFGKEHLRCSQPDEQSSFGVNFNIKNESGIPLLNFIVQHNWIEGLKFLLL